MGGVQSRDPSDLLEAEHAVARVLAQGVELPRLYPELLEAIGGALGWDLAAAWERGPDDVMACTATWSAPGVDGAAFSAHTRRLRLTRGDGLPGRVWRTGRAVRVPDLAADRDFPPAVPAAHRGPALRGVLPDPQRARRHRGGRAVRPRAGPSDRALLGTMASLGRRSGRRRARRGRSRRCATATRARARSSTPRSTASSRWTREGRVVEVNRATERTFGYRAERDGRPRPRRPDRPAERLRALHRARRASATSRPAHGRMVDHPVELDGPCARTARVFPVEIAITRPELAGPAAVHRLRPRRHGPPPRRRGAARARGRAGRAAARRDARRQRGRPRRRLLRRHRGGRPAARRAARRTWSATSRATRRPSSAAGAPRGRRRSRSARACRSTARRRRRACGAPGRPARVDTYDGVTGDARRAPARARLPLRRRPRRSCSSGRLWGAVIVSTVEPEPFAAGRRGAHRRASPSSSPRRSPTPRRASSSPRRARASSQAGDDERRRLERNLHDGAQQRLVSLALTLRLVERKLDERPGDGAPDARRTRATSSPRRSRSCASSPAASTRPCSPTAGSARRSTRSRPARRCRSSSPARSTRGCRPRSRRRRTTSSPRR